MPIETGHQDRLVPWHVWGKVLGTVVGPVESKRAKVSLDSESHLQQESVRYAVFISDAPSPVLCAMVLKDFSVLSLKT